MKNYHIPRINDGEILSADYSANIDGEVLPVKRVRVQSTHSTHGGRVIRDLLTRPSLLPMLISAFRVK